MTSTMYIPLRNVSDAANSEHRTFGQFMAGEVDVRVIVNAYLYAKMGPNSRELRANLSQIRIRKCRSRHRRTAQYE